MTKRKYAPPITEDQLAYIEAHMDQAPEATAEVLGLHRSTIMKRMKRLGYKPSKYLGSGKEYRLAQFFERNIVPKIYGGNK